MQKGQALIYLLIGIVVIAVVGGAFYLSRSTAPKPSTITLQPTPTPDASREPTGSVETTNWKTYTSSVQIPGGKYEFKYPQDWRLVADNIFQQQGRATLIYTFSDKDYKVHINAAERGGPQADEIRSENISLGEYRFVKRSWVKDNQPFYIVYMPDSENFRTGNMEISLPPTDQKTYINFMEKILTSFQFF